MKSAYELAMERLSKQSPSAKLSPEQKKQIADTDALYRSKIAEREIFLGGELNKAREQGDPEAIAQLERQISSERRRLEEECEEKKERIRKAA